MIADLAALLGRKWLKFSDKNLISQLNFTLRPKATISNLFKLGCSIFANMTSYFVSSKIFNDKNKTKHKQKLKKI